MPAANTVTMRLHSQCRLDLGAVRRSPPSASFEFRPLGATRRPNQSEADRYAASMPADRSITTYQSRVQTARSSFARLCLTAVQGVWPASPVDDRDGTEVLPSSEQPPRRGRNPNKPLAAAALRREKLHDGPHREIRILRPIISRPRPQPTLWSHVRKTSCSFDSGTIAHYNRYMGPYIYNSLSGTIA